MRRITIRNLGSTNVAKPRVFDAFIDGGRVFFEVKSGSRSVETVALDDILDQIAFAETEGDIYKKTLIGIGGLEKRMGRKAFEDVLGKYIVKPAGAPTLVLVSDTRKPISTAQADFAE